MKIKVNISEFRKNTKKYMEIDEDVDICAYGKVVKTLLRPRPDIGNVVQDVVQDEENVVQHDEKPIQNATLAGMSKLDLAREALKLAEEKASHLGVGQESTSEPEYPGVKEFYNEELGEMTALSFEDLKWQMQNHKKAVAEWMKR